MKSETKTAEQIEFQELFERVEKLGFKAVDVTRKLGYSSRAAVSMILKGRTGVHESRLQTLRDWVVQLEEAKEKGENIEQKYGDLQMLNDRLEFLREKDPGRFESAKAVITSLHDHAVKGVSSTVASAAEQSQTAASAVARSESQSPSPKREAAAPTVRKRGPKRDAGSGSINKPAAPKQAPK